MWNVSTHTCNMQMEKQIFFSAIMSHTNTSPAGLSVIFLFIFGFSQVLHFTVKILTCFRALVLSSEAGELMSHQITQIITGTCDVAVIQLKAKYLISQRADTCPHLSWVLWEHAVRSENPLNANVLESPFFPSPRVFECTMSTNKLIVIPDFCPFSDRVLYLWCNTEQYHHWFSFLDNARSILLYF